MIDANLQLLAPLGIASPSVRFDVPETPEDAGIAIDFGAEGIGLFRTEHMFYGTGSEEPLFILRKMIMAGSEAERRATLEELYPFVKRDMKATLEIMGERPVTFRLLDPPLHEFVPQNEAERTELAEALKISAEELDRRVKGHGEGPPDERAHDALLILAKMDGQLVGVGAQRRAVAGGGEDHAIVARRLYDEITKVWPSAVD